ncbi:MAG TPA: hypothetical protein VHT27_02290 [Solirubrobacteraceae bacterium]|jgi:hypothetical protein|nr:hypothetical protein [Solirubrobacteraceae bacterium]
MRIALGAAGGAALALLAASMLGTAAAEGPAATPTRTVSVEGVAMVPIAQGANAATADGTYRQALAAAVTDAQGKAEFLAGKVSATLGAAQAVYEDGGGISCANASNSEYVEYEGEQPDFGTATARLPAPVGASAPAAASPAPKPALRHRRRRTKRVKAAASGGCTLSAQVSLVYAIG